MRVVDPAVGAARRLPRWVLPAAGAAVLATAATVLLIVRAAGAACPTADAAPPAERAPAAPAAGQVPAAPAAGWAPEAPAAGRVPAAAPVPVRIAAAGLRVAAEPRSGKATYYAANGGGNCSFEASGPGMYVALGPGEYAAGAACGGYLDVTGPKGTVRVKVTDQCPECEPGHLDLSREAFAKIGAVASGIIPVTYRQVADPKLPAALTVRIKDGASRYWFAARIDNHGNPLRSVEVRSGSGWIALARADYNYWLRDGGAGAGPFTLRLTDTAGHVATVAGVALAPQRVQQTGVWMYGAAPATGASSTPAGSPAASGSPAPSPSGAAVTTTPVAVASSVPASPVRSRARRTC